jgi:hypothetical protein
MEFSDFKMYGINTLALGVTMLDIEIPLKIILLTVTIGYTIDKWMKLKK